MSTSSQNGYHNSLHQSIPKNGGNTGLPANNGVDGYAGRSAIKKFVRFGRNAVPECVESSVLVMDKEAGCLVEEHTEYVLLDTFGRYVSAKDIRGISWGGYTYTADSGFLCLNPWLLHTEARWCCFGRDGLMTPFDVRACLGGCAGLCLQCFRRNNWMKLFRFFGTTYY